VNETADISFASESLTRHWNICFFGFILGCILLDCFWIFGL